MTESHLDLLCDVGRLSAALAGSTDIEHFLFRLCEVVAGHMKAEVCSIYLLDEGSRELVMRATVGLDPSSVGAIKLGEGEGLIGTALKELRPILDNDASSNPRYLFFPGSGEKNFDAFLAIPIVRGIEKIGVLAVQRTKEKPFGKDDLKALVAVASQLAGTVENSRAFMSLVEAPVPTIPPDTSSPIRGKCVSGEYARGTLLHFGRSRHPLKSMAGRIPQSLTLEDLERALAATAAEIRKIQEGIAEKVPEAASLVFDAHLLMLRDRRFGGAMLDKVREGCEAGSAVLEVAGSFMDRFSGSPHAYLREKAGDVEDIALRIVEHLGSGSRSPGGPEGRPVYIAAALLPSDVVLLSSEGAAGVVLAQGGEMTHVTILAQSLDLPLFLAGEPSLFSLPEGREVLLDGATGNIYVDPSGEIVELFEAGRDATHDETEKEVTAAGQDLKDMGVRLLANINLLRDAPLAVKLGAEGVGLYRTEFPFLIRSSFPSEDEQYQVYCRLLEEMAGRPVTFRTLDVGGEKALAYYDHGGEENPELGLRSIRFSLRHRDIFTAQIRAILRSASAGSVKIMFPMISSLDEYREARRLVEECRGELETEMGEAIAAPLLGIMIEVPSIVTVIDEAAREADFLSVGTNDLVQYLLAADRGNEKVSDYFCLHHPAVLRTLAEIAAAAGRAGKEITVCGEMAHMDRFVPFLFGIGLKSLSVAPGHLPRLRAILSGLSASATEKHAARALKSVTINEAAEVISSFAR